MASALWILTALCAIPPLSSSPLPPTLLGPKRPLISQAIARYNKESGSDFLFMLLSDQTESEGTNEARFTIKETVCRKPDSAERKVCAHQPGGLEKNCSAEMRENGFTVRCSGREQSGRKSEEGSEPSAGGSDVIVTESFQSASPVSDHHDEGALADIVIQLGEDPPRDGGPNRPQADKRKPLSRVFLGRFLCLECIFNEFPRK